MIVEAYYAELALRHFKCTPSPQQIVQIKNMLYTIPNLFSATVTTEQVLPHLEIRSKCASNYPVKT